MNQKNQKKRDFSKHPEQKKPESAKAKPEQKQPEQPKPPKLSIGKIQEETDAKIAALAGKLLDYDKRQEETDAKIVALASAVGSLNENFTKFLDTLKEQAPAGSQATPPLETVPGALPPKGNTPPEPVLLPGADQPAPAEPSKQDKLLAWANILAKLAESGKATEANPTDAMPSSLMQLVNSLKVMGELRKTFLGELKEMLSFAKGIETTVKSPPARPEGTTHLPEE